MTKSKTFDKNTLTKANRAIKTFEAEMYTDGVSQDSIDEIQNLYFDFNNRFRDRNDNLNEDAKNSLNKPALKTYGHLAYYPAVLETPALESSHSLSKYQLIKDLYIESFQAYEACNSAIDIKHVNNDMKKLKKDYPELESESRKELKLNKGLAR